MEKSARGNGSLKIPSPDPRVHAVRNLLIWAAFGGLLLSGCAPEPAGIGSPSSLAPRGPGAANITSLWWIMFGLGTAVFVVVTLLFLYTIYTRRRLDSSLVNGEIRPDEPEAMHWIWWGGIIIPAVILAVTFFFNLRSLSALASPTTAPTLTVDVIGFQWWWEVRYPDDDFATANELHIPVGQPVEIRLTSQDVIHSFWVPELHGKLDLNPGETNTMWIQADFPGVYRGICAEFCGLQHAKMQFVVVAEPADEFAAWLERQRQPAPEPEDDNIRLGQQVFLGSSCVYCHTVRGTNATGEVGPDLTHLASRLTLGAGILENNRGSLAGWIVDPQHLKPGNLMPPTNIDSQDLQALLDYLETLR